MHGGGSRILGAGETEAEEWRSTPTCLTPCVSVCLFLSLCDSHSSRVTLILAPTSMPLLRLFPTAKHTPHHFSAHGHLANSSLKAAAECLSEVDSLSPLGHYFLPHASTWMPMWAGRSMGSRAVCFPALALASHEQEGQVTTSL